MAAFRPAKATLQECYEYIEESGKATPSVVKRVQSLEDFSEYNEEYVRLICRTPGRKTALMPMVTSECDVLVVQSHVPFPEKWKRGVQLDYIHRRQLGSMMPSDISWELTSLVKFPPDIFRHPKSGKMMNKYTQTQMKGWLPYLMHEIAVTKPKLVVASTTEVVKMLGLKMSNTKNRGEIHYSSVIDLPVLIILHPKALNMIRQTSSGAMWGDDYYAPIARDLRKASDLVHNRVELRELDEALEETLEHHVTVCTSLDEVQSGMDIIMSLQPSQFTSFDLETNSLDPWWRGVNRFGEQDEARILTAQIGYRKEDGFAHSLVIPLWHRDNVLYDPNEAFEEMLPYIRRGSAKVGHNITFDICFLAVTTGERLQGDIVDTMLALHSLDSGIKGCYGLKAAVWDYLLDSGLGGYEDLLRIDESREGWIPDAIELVEEIEDEEDECA